MRGAGDERHRDRPSCSIGAGSTVFTPGLLTDLARPRSSTGSTVHLVDLDAEAAETMARLGRRIAAERGVPD